MAPSKRNNTSLIQQLDRTITETGEAEDKDSARQRLIKFLGADPADYSHLHYSEEEAQRIRYHLTHLSTGSTAAIPIYCGGERCPWAFSCPFLAVGKPPLGLPCLVEQNLLVEWRRKYIMEYEIEPDSMTELTLVNELAEIELMLWRVNQNLAKPENAELVQDEAVGFDRQGNPLTKRTISAFMEMKERLLNRRAKTIRLMVGDREGKWKQQAALKIKQEDDPSSQFANLKRDMKRLQAQTKVLSTQLPVTEASGNAEEKPVSPEDLISQVWEDEDK